MLAYARRRAEPSLAEDATAETFLVAWRRLDDVPEEARPWLLSICRRTLANRRRSERRTHALRRRLGAEPVAPARDIAARVESAEVIREAFGTLGALDREILALIAWDGLSPRDAARVIGRPASIVHARLFRARRRLARALARCEEEPTDDVRPREEAT